MAEKRAVVAVLRSALLVRMERKHAPIAARGACRCDAGCVAPDHLLPNPRRQAADGAHAGRIAAGADGIDRAVAGAAAYRPKRCRFRYRPFREIPSALATASTLPWFSRKAALIISNSTLISVGVSLSDSLTASSRRFAGSRRKMGMASMMSREMSSGSIVEFGSTSATMRLTSLWSWRTLAGLR